MSVRVWCGLLLTVLVLTTEVECVRQGLVASLTNVYRYNFDEGTSTSVFSSSTNLRAIGCVPLSGNCVVGGDAGFLRHTSDLGATWTNVEPPTLQWRVTSISCSVFGVCVLTADEEIWESTTSGLIWNRVYVNSGNEWYDGVTCTSKTCVAVGEDCEMAVRTTAVAQGIWQNYPLNCAPASRSVNDDSDLVDVGFVVDGSDYNIVIASEEDGFAIGQELTPSSWLIDTGEDHSPGVSNDATALACRPPVNSETDSVCLLASRPNDPKVQVSVNAANTWTQLDGNDFRGAHCLGDTCVAVGDDGHVAVVINDGGQPDSGLPGELTDFDLYTDNGRRYRDVYVYESEGTESTWMLQGTSSSTLDLSPLGPEDNLLDTLSSGQYTVLMIAGTLALIACIVSVTAVCVVMRRTSTGASPRRTDKKQSLASQVDRPDSLDLTESGRRAQSVMEPAMMSTAGVAFCEDPVSSRMGALPSTIVFSEDPASAYVNGDELE